MIDIFNALKVLQDAANAPGKITFELVDDANVRVSADGLIGGRGVRVDIVIGFIELYDPEVFLKRMHQAGCQIRRFAKDQHADKLKGLVQ